MQMLTVRVVSCVSKKFVCMKIASTTSHLRLFTSAAPSTASEQNTAPLHTQSLKPTEISFLKSEKLDKLLSEISGLTLLETASLVQLLKTKFNIQELSMSSAPSSTAPSSAPVVEEAEVKKEKTEFTVRLDKFDAASKAKVIREMKGILPGVNLVEAKKFVEAAPKVIVERVNKEEAERIKRLLEAAGATVSVE